jgi:hypothetical protein
VNQYWFKPRRYDLGAYPSTWEGWLSTVIFVFVEVLIGIAFPPDHRAFTFFGAAFMALIMFIWLCWIKTEGGWRWGWRDDDERR